jgi:hypothetical protein
MQFKTMITANTIQGPHHQLHLQAQGAPQTSHHLGIAIVDAPHMLTDHFSETATSTQQNF